MAARLWTEAQRRAAAERIRAHRPWTRSTGPRTAAGKARVARNGVKHGCRGRAMRDLLRTMSDLARLRRLALRRVRWLEFRDDPVTGPSVRAMLATPLRLPPAHTHERKSHGL